MTRQTNIFENATPIVENKIRQARADQSEEARRMVSEALRGLLARFRRAVSDVPTGRLRGQ